jgi:hypothetical protein
MLYSKNGSIPYPYTDGTEGWIEVPDKPEAPEGKEVVWWYPPGWVIRDPKPADEENVKWSWSQSNEQWVRYEIPLPVINNGATDTLPILEETIVTAATSTSNDNDMTTVSFIDSVTVDVNSLPEEPNGN